MSEWQLPLMDQNNFFVQPLLRQAAANGVQAILDGEGGDELFGATRGLIADRLRRGRLLAASGSPGACRARAIVPRCGPSRGCCCRCQGRTALRRHQAFRRARPPDRGSPSWFRPESARLLADTDDSLAWKRLSGPRWWAELADSLTSGVAARGVDDHARRRAATAGWRAPSPARCRTSGVRARLPPELSFDPHRSPMLRASMAGSCPTRSACGRGSRTSTALLRGDGGARPETVRRIVLDPGAELGAFVDLEPSPATCSMWLRERSARPAPRHWTASAWRLLTAEIWLVSQMRPRSPRRAGVLGAWPTALQLNEVPPGG